MGSKYKTLNGLIWLSAKLIVVAIILCMCMYLVKTNMVIQQTGDNVQLGIALLNCMIFFIIGFGIVKLYNSMRKDVLVGEGSNVRYKIGSYHLSKIVVDGVVKSTVTRTNTGSFGADIYGEFDNDEFNSGDDFRSAYDDYGDIASEHSEDEDEALDFGVKHKKEDDEKWVDKVQGIDELKYDIQRIIDSMINPDKYSKIGAKPTKGVLLYGPPGNGKTMLARAIAHDCKASFKYASGSDFMEKYVGVGAKRVRKLFKEASECKPCIVFVDEIDAIAVSRDTESNGERLQTINAFLAELDGFVEKEGILVIGATNRLDMLDSAFTRSGRFDLKLAVGLPDRKGRLEILKQHAKNKVMADSVDLKDLANRTVGFSGADLANLLNEGALIAAAENKNAIDGDDIQNAFFKILMHGNKKKSMQNEDTTKIIAWHEAGHTLATKLLTNDNVSSVTIIGSTSGAGGVTFTSPEESVLQSKKDIENEIKVLYAGRAAELMLLGSEDKITTGASQDIKEATRLIKSYTEVYGMGRNGLIDVSQFTSYTSDRVNEASELSNKLYKEVVDFLNDNRETLRDLANELIDKETLYEKDIDNIISRTSKSVG